MSMVFVLAKVLKPQVFSCVLDFLAEGKPVMSDEVASSDTAILDTGEMPRTAVYHEISLMIPSGIIFVRGCDN